MIKHFVIDNVSEEIVSILRVLGGGGCRYCEVVFILGHLNIRVKYQQTLISSSSCMSYLGNHEFICPWKCLFLRNSPDCLPLNIYDSTESVQITVMG